MTVLIDGPSGSGKTTLAKQLADITGFQLVHLDDFYPGWAGLARGRDMVAHDVLHPTRPGFRQWNWQEDRPGDWVSLDPRRPMIVEGVGAISVPSVQAAAHRGTFLTVLVKAQSATRRERALNRDSGFAPWWEMWASQEVEHFEQLPAVDLELWT
ncbi:nucleoside/nucleotide kinase family protein [Corynebacterium epidermidicanis]